MSVKTVQLEGITNRSPNSFVLQCPMNAALVFTEILQYNPSMTVGFPVFVYIKLPCLCWCTFWVCFMLCRAPIQSCVGSVQPTMPVVYTRLCTGVILFDNGNDFVFSSALSVFLCSVQCFMVFLSYVCCSTLPWLPVSV